MTVRSVQKRGDNRDRRNVAVDGEGLVVALVGQTNVELRFSPDSDITVDGREHALSRVVSLWTSVTPSGS